MQKDLENIVRDIRQGKEDIKKLWKAVEQNNKDWEKWREDKRQSDIKIQAQFNEVARKIQDIVRGTEELHRAFNNSDIRKIDRKKDKEEQKQL